jgi:hypothetical protein
MRASRRPHPSPSEVPANPPEIPADREGVDTNATANTARVSVQRHLSRPTLGAWQLNQTVLLLIIFLAVVGVLSLVSQRVTWPSIVLIWWPLAVIGVAALWFIAALLRHSANGWLFSTALLGLGISLLLTTAYNMSFGGIWLGVGLITIGAGTLLRGLLWGAR